MNRWFFPSSVVVPQTRSVKLFTSRMSEGLGNVPSGDPGLPKPWPEKAPQKCRNGTKKFKDLSWLIEFII